ncbi:MAG: hypothetical protein PHO33_03865 [Clostridia bacterium]|nr:hypothetical protein [Clostridia bacterium]
MKKLLSIILLITLTTSLISSCNENNDISSQSEYYTSNGSLSTLELNSVASETSTKAESTESSSIVKYPIDSVTPPEYPTLTIIVPALPTGGLASAEVLQFDESYEGHPSRFFSYILTDAQLSVVSDYYHNNKFYIERPNKILPYEIFIIKEYKITKEQYTYCRDEFLKEYGYLYKDDIEFMKRFSDEYINTLFLPTDAEIRKAAMHEMAYYHNGSVYSYRDMCMLSPVALKAMNWTEKDVDEYLKRVYKDFDLNNEDAKRVYNAAKNNFMVKLNYEYSLFDLSINFSYDKVYGDGLEIIKKLAQEKKWNRRTYLNEFEDELKKFHFLQLRVNEQGTIATNFEPEDAPIILMMYKIPREKLEKALSEYERETSKQIYTKEDLDALYSFDIVKIEKQFLAPLHIRADSKLYTFDYLLELNNVNDLEQIKLSKKELLDYYAKVKEYFNSHGDNRFYARIDYLIEYVEQKVK